MENLLTYLILGAPMFSIGIFGLICQHQFPHRHADRHRIDPQRRGPEFHGL